MKLLLFLLLTIFISTLQSETVFVESISGLQDAINNANPGDEIVLKNGVYSVNSDVNINAINGTEENWITIRAEQVGAVEITGDKSFNIESSSYVHLTGFKIKQNVESNCVEIAKSQHIRLSHCTFDMVEDGSKSYWLEIASDAPGCKYIRIDHNEFSERYDEGCFIVIPAKSYGTSQYVQIDHNHFKGHYFGGANGGEAIRYGNSDGQNFSSYAVIEDNLFEKCKGDPEVISVKSTNLTVRRNTLRDCNGSIVLRHGDSCLVEGNFVLNSSGGIRFYGDNQKIIGNYFYNNDNLNNEGGTSPVRSAIAVGAGDMDDLANGQNTYDRPEDCLVAFNTLVYNKGANLNIGVQGTSSYPPKNLTIANNIIVSDKQPAVSVQIVPDNVTYEGNILFGTAAAGDIADSNYQWVDPDISINAYGVYHLNENSPAIDSAIFITGNEGYVTDIDGQSRSIYDIGADEFSADTVWYRPLTPEDVGPIGNEIHCSTALEIQFAMRNAQPGDKILIEPGIYIGSKTFSGSSAAHFFGENNGTAEDPILLFSAIPADKAILKGESTNNDYVLYITGDNWIVRDLEVQTGKKGIMLDNSNYTQIINTDVHTIGEEGIHIRDGSSFNLISYCKIYETGLLNPQFGEGVYLGSDYGKWAQFIKETDYNVVSNCIIGPNVRAESVDIKEGSTGNIIEYCMFDGEGISGENAADSFIDAKGNESIIRNNTGYRRENANITDAFQVHKKETVWGFDNAFVANEVFLDNTTAFVVDVSSGSAITSDNIRHPEGNMYSGNYTVYENVPPRIKIISPLSGSIIDPGSPISITANAIDIDGQIIEVEFYANNTKIGSTNTAPYTFLWNNLASGKYDIFAKATDNEFLQISSDTITITLGGKSKFNLTETDVLASADDGNVAANTIDGNFGTRWAAEGDGQWIRFDLQKPVLVSFLKIAFYRGNVRSAIFDIQVSDDDVTWKIILANVQSSGTSTDLENFEFDDITTSYIRYLGHTNTLNDWNTITELEIWGSDTTTTALNDVTSEIPKKFELYSNYPNPFNNQTILSFSLPSAGEISISIYDIRGRLVEKIRQKNSKPGLQQVSIDAANWNSGIYLFTVAFNNEKKSGRMLLLR